MKLTPKRIIAVLAVAGGCIAAYTLSGPPSTLTVVSAIIGGAVLMAVYNFVRTRDPMAPDPGPDWGDISPDEVARAKAHMLRDMKEAGEIPENLTVEMVDRIAPAFWQSRAINYPPRAAFTSR